MPTLPPVQSNGPEGLRGFSKRASRVVSNGALYDLVQDMAQVLDTRLPAIEAKVDRILRLLERHDV